MENSIAILHNFPYTINKCRYWYNEQLIFVVKEKSLEDTVRAAHDQVEQEQYEANLIEKGFSKDIIRKYGFAFQGKNVLIGDAY